MILSAILFIASYCRVPDSESEYVLTNEDWSDISYVLQHEPATEKSPWSIRQKPSLSRGLPVEIVEWINENYSGDMATDPRKVFKEIVEVFGDDVSYRKVYDYVRRFNGFPKKRKQKRKRETQIRFPKEVVEWMREFVDSNPGSSPPQIQTKMIEKFGEEFLTIEQIINWKYRNYNVA